MKKVVSILVVVLGVLSVAALMPRTSYALLTDPYLITPVPQHFVDLVPSESMPVDTTGPKFVATPSDHYKDVSESQKFDRTVPKFVATPSYHSLDVSESQPRPIDAGINDSKATATIPKKCSGC